MVSNLSKQFVKMRLRQSKGSRDDGEVGEKKLRMRLAQRAPAVV